MKQGFQRKGLPQQFYKEVANVIYFCIHIFSTQKLKIEFLDYEKKLPSVYGMRLCRQEHKYT